MEKWKQYLTRVTAGGKLIGFEVSKCGGFGLLTAKTEEQVEAIESSVMFSKGLIWEAKEGEVIEAKAPEQVQPEEKSISEEVFSDIFTQEEMQKIKLLTPESLEILKENALQLIESEGLNVTLEEKGDAKGADANDEIEVPAGKVDIESLTAGQIKQYLDLHRVQYPKKAGKEELYKIYLEN